MSNFSINNSPNENPQQAVVLKGTDNNANERTITLSAPQNSSGLTSSVNLVLPSNDGNDGQVLTTDGSGNLSWSSGGTSSTLLLGNDVYTASGANFVPINDNISALIIDNGVTRNVLLNVVVDTSVSATGSNPILTLTSDLFPASTLSNFRVRENSNIESANMTTSGEINIASITNDAVYEFTVSYVAA